MSLYDGTFILKDKFMNYEYSREEIGPDSWNINNPYALDAKGNQQTLLDCLQQNMPEIKCTDVDLKDALAIVVCADLDEKQKTQLDNWVAWHKGQTFADPTDYQFLHDNTGQLWKVFISSDGIFQSAKIDK